MELPQEVQDIIQSDLTNVKSKYLNGIFSDLSKDYMTNTGTNKDFLKNKDYVLVYSLSRMNATFSVIDYVLNKYDSYIGEDIKTFLDVGAGMGTASINLLYHYSPKKIELVEKNKDMIALGKKILNNYDVDYLYHQCDIRDFDTDKKYDVVLASYFLSELDEKSRLNVVKKLWGMTNKHLIICDTGTPDGYKNNMQIKNYLLELGGSLLLPCPTNNCPLTNDWCHFVTRVNRLKINMLVKNAQVPYEDEKFTYLIMAKTGSNILTNVVIRHPIKEKSIVKLKLCTKDKISDEIITKNNPLYKSARKVKIGDEIK